MTCIFGITGTNGKTTTAYMTSAILEKAGKKCALIGTVVHKIGDKTYEAVNTTPGRETLRQYMQEACAQGIDTMVMEVSSHALAQGRADEMPIRYAAFMNLTRDHLDYHKSMEEYYLTKKKLFDFKTLDAAIINIDDSYGKRLARELKEERDDIGIFTVSIGGAPEGDEDAEADFTARIKKEDFSGSEFDVKIGRRVFGAAASTEEFSLMRPGRHHIYDALSALALTAAYGGAEYKEAAKEALAEFAGAPGRFEIITGKNNDRAAICDYAHTPDALENLLTTVREIRDKDERMKRGRIITVFGCGGDRDKGKRPEMGRISGRLSDYTIITSDNPRSEDPLDIINEIEEGLYGSGAEYSVCTDRRSALARAVMISRPGDIIVAAGKGHETYQIIAGQKKHFDDREILRELL